MPETEVLEEMKSHLKNYPERKRELRESFERVEEKLDRHIEQHDIDYKKLLLWAIGILISVFSTLGTWFITYGSLQEKVASLEDEQKQLVTRQEYAGLLNLLDERFKNLNEKLDKIITATR